MNPESVQAASASPTRVPSRLGTVMHVGGASGSGGLIVTTMLDEKTANVGKAQVDSGSFSVTTKLATVS